MECNETRSRSGTRSIRIYTKEIKVQKTTYEINDRSANSIGHSDLQKYTLQRKIRETARMRERLQVGMRNTPGI